jgi:hypothetical protein
MLADLPYHFLLNLQLSDCRAELQESRTCWQCLQEERGRAGSQQRSQESEFEEHGGNRGLDMKKAGGVTASL